MEGSVLIVGGYGVVGLQLSRIIRERQPELPLLIGGRSATAAEDAAGKIGNAVGVVLDVMHRDPLAGISESIVAVMAVANDPQNNLMRSAIARGIPYVDITRWTERLHEAVLLANVLHSEASVALASSWMAGVTAIVAKEAASMLSLVETIDTAILYRLADKAGPNSVEYADRLSIPFRVKEGGEWVSKRAMSEAREVTFESGYSGSVSRFDEPSQETLALYTGASSVSSRIGYDSESTNRVMAFLVRSRIWKLISGAAFTKFRHSLIYNPGEGASHEIVIDASGYDGSRRPQRVRATILDPAGQTHLTAVGAYLQLQETLGLDGRPRRKAGVYFPESHDDFSHVIKTFEGSGIQIKIHPVD